MTLARKIWLLVTIPFVIAIATYLVATRPFRRDLLLTEASRDARDDVLVLQTAIARGLVDEANGTADLEALTESIAQAEHTVGVAVYGANGERLAVSSGLTANARIDELAKRALASHDEIRELRENPTHLEHAFPLTTSGRVAGAVVVRDIEYIDALVERWTASLLLAGLAMSSIIFVVAGPLVRRIVSEPLARVISGVEEVAAGKLEARVDDRAKNEAKDEIGRLARSFNAMTESLRTARAKAESESATRAALEERMRRMQTLAAAGEVAASLAHEIGSPLNVILGRARMMAAREGTPDVTRRDLEIVAEQTERITRVVKKLLEISRPARGAREAVDVRAVVEETLAFLAPECRKRAIATSIDAGEGAPSRVWANRDQMVQIVFNLCHNAMQAQPHGGRIDVRLERDLERGHEPDATALALVVRDAGPGVDEALRGRIFDPFVTTKRGDEGSGLGLAIVDGMARELGGKVLLEDAPGGGAAFRVILPTREGAS